MVSTEPIRASKDKEVHLHDDGAPEDDLAAARQPLPRQLSSFSPQSPKERESQSSHLRPILPDINQISLLDTELFSLRDQAHDAHVVGRQERVTLSRLFRKVLGVGYVGEVLSGLILKGCKLEEERAKGR